jgi:hypothetical protein
VKLRLLAVKIWSWLKSHEGGPTTKKHIAILILTIGLGFGLANLAYTGSFARAQDEQMKTEDKIGRDKMRGDNMRNQDEMGKKKTGASKRD